MKKPLCDTCIFLSLWHEDNATRFKLESENFFRLITSTNCVICVSQESRKEIEKNPELAVYLPDFDSYLKELSDKRILEYTTITDTFTEKDIYEIQRIRKQARGLELDLSTTDATLILIAKKKNLVLISNEHNIIDFCSHTNYCEARYPDEFNPKAKDLRDIK